MITPLLFLAAAVAAPNPAPAKKAAPEPAKDGWTEAFALSKNESESECCRT